MNLRYESIADSRDGFDESRIGCGISQRLAEFLDDGVQAVFKIDKGILRPEFRLHFLAGDHVSGTPDQKVKNLKGLAVKFETDAEFVKDPRASIYSEIAKA
ncbi:MAG: hypothetical protein WBE20_05085 [Candidatus Acidiferrales bacterium]